MSGLRKVWFCVLLALLTPSLALATLTAEHFNYGPVEIPLMGLDGGENWGGAWAGYAQLSPKYSPGVGLSYTGPCYYNEQWEGHEGNDPSQGGTVHQSYRGSPRPFPVELTGIVWASALVRLGPNDSFRGFFLGNEALTFWFGFNASCKLYITFDGHATDEGAVVYSSTLTHLVVARLEFDYNEQGHDRIDIWADPQGVCNGESGLGTPEASMDGFNIGSVWDVLMFELGNGSNVDAIRVSYDPDGRLDEVMYWDLSSPVEANTWTHLKGLFR